MTIDRKGLSVKRSALVLALGVFILGAGCQGPQRDIALRKEVDELRLEKTRLEGELDKAEEENVKLKEQLKTLTGIEKEADIEEIYDLEGIRLTKRSGLYDKDKDGKAETLIVYLQAVDRSGDAVKAAGAAEVELWDLSKGAEDAMLGQWQVEPAELKKLWYDTLFSANYRLTFDADSKIAEFTEPLTVKVTFTDYITGKVFKEQKMIKP